jgi:hypothetical protein
MHADVVIAIGPEDTLPAILTQIHNAGFGANAMVLRPRRTSIERQLQRMDIPTGKMPERVGAADAALVIHAASRSGIAANLTHRHGASATWVVSPNGSWNLLDDDLVPEPVSRPKTTPGTIPLTDTPANAVPDGSPDI